MLQNFFEFYLYFKKVKWTIHGGFMVAYPGVAEQRLPRYKFVGEVPFSKERINLSPYL